MKILAIGDFHGKFPKRIVNHIRKIRPDLILCTGDLPDTESERRLIFKHYDELTEKSLSDIIGKKKVMELERNASKSVEPILRTLNSFGIPVIMIWGNSDDVNYEKNPRFTHLNKRVKKFKNITFVAKQRAITRKDVQILAFSGYRYPIHKGFRKMDLIEELFVELENSVWNGRLGKLFSRMDKEKKTIFLTHDPPRGYFDKVQSDNPMKGKNIGDEYFKEYIKEFQPNLCLCGHMHEYQDKRRLKKSMIVSVGAMCNNAYTLVDTDNNTIRFFRKDLKKTETHQ